jgi:hypothetical protein
LKRFIDDIAVEVIEAKLISPLGDIFSPVAVSAMPADLVTRIAGESEENRGQREQLTKQLDVLMKGSDTCKRFIGVRLLDTDDTTQFDSQFNSDSANDEYSDSDQESNDSLQDDVRSLTDRSEVTETTEESPADIIVTAEVQTAEGSAEGYKSSSKKSKKASKIAAKRALFE